MIKELVCNAVRIKMEARMESPLISVYEFCYAAGLAVGKMKLPAKQQEALLELSSFADFKTQAQELVRDSQIFTQMPQGERLKSLILGCRHKGQLDADARELFQLGCTLAAQDAYGR